MSNFHEELATYLAFRQGDLTPESFHVTKHILYDFDCFLEDKGHQTKTIQEEVVNEWIASVRLNHAQKTTSDWVSILRGYLRFLRYEGFEIYLPRCPKAPDKYIPYIFSDNELEKIFATADNLQTKQRHPQNPYMHLEFSMLLRLLYGCGLRLGEALSLRIEDVNLIRGTLFLKETKNKKQRLVPMDDSLTEMLQRYCYAMHLTNNPNALLFPGKTSEFPLSAGTARGLFRRILIETGIYIQPESHTRGQCLHCFRHLFAIKAFAQAEQQGRSVDESVPFLSVYLGHRDLDETEKYLKFSSDIFPEYTDKFESYVAGVFAEVSL